MFRPGQVQLPAVCCMCLSPATTTFRSPMQTNDRSELHVPLCKPCVGRLRRRWWLALLLIAAGAFVVAGCLAGVIPGGDPTGRWILFGILGFFGALIGGVIGAGAIAKPYRMKVVDADRGIVKFAASHPQYTQMLIEQVRQSDGVGGR
jgi:hypothetical protein